MGSRFTCCSSSEERQIARSILKIIRLGLEHSRIRERSPKTEFECCSKISVLCLTLDFIRMFESPHSKVECSKPNVRECRIRMLKKSDFWIRITTLYISYIPVVKKIRPTICQNFQISGRLYGCEFITMMSQVCIQNLWSSR